MDQTKKGWTIIRDEGVLAKAADLLVESGRPPAKGIANQVLWMEWETGRYVLFANSSRYDIKLVGGRFVPA